MVSATKMITIVAVACCVAASTARADEWNDRTRLTFSAPVMIPGATLPPGTYIFELADVAANRHLVRVREEGSGSVLAQVQAVPISRPQANNDVVLQFNPTDQGTAPALKGWFYPGSRYGHEFVYPEEQARNIAGRTKTIVLSIDVPGSDSERGVLRNIDATGQRTEWKGDEATMREWEAWRKTRTAAGTDDRQRATAPIVRADFEGTRVALDDLEDNPSRYLGQRISVDGEIEEVFGPRMFTIDERNWGDLDGEILVLLPTRFAALVKEGDRVTISGTMRPFVRHEFEREWGWLGLDPTVEVDVSTKPVLVAERLIGGDNNVAMVIDVTPGADRAVGTSGSVAAKSDAAGIATGDEGLVGSMAHLSDIKVAAAASPGGFFVMAADRYIYVLPAQSGVAVSGGETITIDGVILRMPREMSARLSAPGELNEDIYIYATNVGR